MTATPELRARLVLVAIHPSLTMVVAPRRNGTVTLGNVHRGPTHRLAYHRCIRATGTTTLCPLNEAKASVLLTLPYAMHNSKMRSYNHDLGR